MSNYHHAPAFLAACGFNPSSPTCAHYSAAECVHILLADLRLDNAPTWTAAPGSQEGLEALRVIMEALDWGWQPNITFKAPDSCAWFSIDEQGWRFQMAQDYGGADTSLFLWTDPTALPRLLHLALALAPTDAPHD